MGKIIKWTDYLYILGCIGFMVYSQLIIKWRIAGKGTLPLKFADKVNYLLLMFFDPFIISAMLSMFLVSILWMAAMTKFELSFAYPFMSITFVLVFIFSVLFMGELFTFGKLIGLILILSGIFVTVRY